MPARAITVRRFAVSSAMILAYSAGPALSTAKLRVSSPPAGGSTEGRRDVCVDERAADALHSSGVEAKPLSDLAHTIGASGLVQGLTEDC
jgi:hypothetical protein